MILEKLSVPLRSKIHRTESGARNEKICILDVIIEETKARVLYIRYRFRRKFVFEKHCRVSSRRVGIVSV